jgi:aminoglycoside/choline kinase family phosphotransferase
MPDSERRHIELLAQELLGGSSLFSRSALARVQALAGDASSRRYHRLYLSESPVSTAILMILNQAKGPVGGGREDKTQDDTFVELAEFFAHHGIMVPEIYSDARPAGALLVEDVGDIALWHFARDELGEAGHEIKDYLGEDALQLLYERAINVIKRIQSIRPDPSSVAYQRYVGFEQYRKEVDEFRDYYAKPKGIRSSALTVVEEFFDSLCESLSHHPRTLSHFDFMSHNIYVTPGGGLRIIDFQDACTVSPVRDIVSLINDRDIDVSLGKSLHRQLLEYYMKEMETGESFTEQYNECLLHWDLRVAGRFIYLCEIKKAERYREWVPGTLRRIGRTLFRVEHSMPMVGDVITILSGLSDEIRRGFEDPWPLPQGGK